MARTTFRTLRLWHAHTLTDQGTLPLEHMPGAAARQGALGAQSHPALHNFSSAPDCSFGSLAPCSLGLIFCLELLLGEEGLSHTLLCRTPALVA